MKHKLIIALIILSTTMWGYSLYEKDFGNNTNNANAKSLAMGGANICSGSRLFDASSNPANLSLLKNNYYLEGSLSVFRSEENRKVPMYNFFDSYIDDAVYSSNTNFYNTPVLGASGSFSFSNNKIALGFIFKPVLDFNFDYDEEVRNNENSDNNNYPKVIANNYFKGEGELNSYSILASYKYNQKISIANNFELNFISLGIDYSILNGNKKQKKQILWSSFAKNKVNAVAYDALPDFLAERSYDIKGNRLTFGFNTLINKRLGIGFSYVTEASLDFDKKLINDENNSLSVNNYNLPSSYNIGLKYKPQSIMQTTVNWDFIIQNYSKIDDMLEDTYTFKFGVEHYIKNRLPLRLGFKYQTSPIDKELTMPTFTCGTGYEVYKNLTWDIAFSFTNRSYNQADLFADSYYDDSSYTSKKSVLWISNFKPKNRFDEDKVEELFMTINSSLSFKW